MLSFFDVQGACKHVWLTVCVSNVGPKTVHGAMAELQLPLSICHIRSSMITICVEQVFRLLASGAAVADMTLEPWRLRKPNRNFNEVFANQHYWLARQLGKNTLAHQNFRSQSPCGTTDGR